jgi:hypothetical protein
VTTSEYLLLYVFVFIFEEFLGVAVTVGIKWSSGPSHLVTYRRGGWIWIAVLYFCVPNIRKDPLNIIPTYKLNPHYKNIYALPLYILTRWQ